MKLAFSDSHKYYIKWPFKQGFIAFKIKKKSLRKRFADMVVVNGVTCTESKCYLACMWLYDFYDTTFSTESQRCHMINIYRLTINGQMISSTEVIGLYTSFPSVFEDGMCDLVV